MTQQEIVDFLMRCRKLDLQKIEWILVRLRDRLRSIKQFDDRYHEFLDL